MSYLWTQHGEDLFIEHVFKLEDWYCFYIETKTAEIYIAEVEFFVVGYTYDAGHAIDANEKDISEKAFLTNNKELLGEIVESDYARIGQSIYPFISTPDDDNKIVNATKSLSYLESEFRYLNCLKIKNMSDTLIKEKGWNQLYKISSWEKSLEDSIDFFKYLKTNLRN